MILDVLPAAFGIASFVCTFVALHRVVRDHNIHQIEFYRAAVPTWLKRLMAFVGVLEVLALSTLSGVLSVILICGTYQARIIEAGKSAVICFGIAVAVLSLVKVTTRINVRRWGYIQFSIFIGLIFSQMLSQFKDPEADWWFDKLKSAVGGNWGDYQPVAGGIASMMKPLFSTENTVNEAAEAYHKIDYLLSTRIVPEVFVAVVPGQFDSLASVLAFVFSAKVAYGFVILPYALLVVGMFGGRDRRE